MALEDQIRQPHCAICHGRTPVDASARIRPEGLKVSHDRPLQLGCSTCRVTQEVPLGDPHELAATARSFFVSHATCRTSIELDGERLRGWAASPHRGG